jgi:hypothetical protein
MTAANVEKAHLLDIKRPLDEYLLICDSGQVPGELVPGELDRTRPVATVCPIACAAASVSQRFPGSTEFIVRSSGSAHNRRI